MNIVGALAKGNSNVVIYFCEYSHSEVERLEIQKLVDATAYNGELRGEMIEILAIESVDEMQNDIRLVGLMYRDEEEGSYESIILDRYQDISDYFSDFFE